MGKTRTTLEAAKGTRWRGFRIELGIVSARCAAPLRPVDRGARIAQPSPNRAGVGAGVPVWLQEVARLAPVFASTGDPVAQSSLRPAEESARMIEALVHTIVALGRIAPHLIIIDDVHWADRDTLAVLTQVGSPTRRLAGPLRRALPKRGGEGGRRGLGRFSASWDRVAGVGRVILSPLSLLRAGQNPVVGSLGRAGSIRPWRRAHCARPAGTCCSPWRRCCRCRSGVLRVGCRPGFRPRPSSPG